MISNNLPLSDQIHVAHEEWSLLDKEANILEAMRSILRERKVKELGDIPKNRAECEVVSSEWYEYYTKEMIEARHKATDAAGKLEYLRRLAKEQSEEGFNRRAEMKL